MGLIALSRRTDSQEIVIDSKVWEYAVELCIRTEPTKYSWLQWSHKIRKMTCGPAMCDALQVVETLPVMLDYDYMEDWKKLKSFVSGALKSFEFETIQA
jgi:hypothetical protein